MSISSMFLCLYAKGGGAANKAHLRNQSKNLHYSKWNVSTTVDMRTSRF